MKSRKEKSLRLLSYTGGRKHGAEELGISKTFHLSEKWKVDSYKFKVPRAFGAASFFIVHFSLFIVHSVVAHPARQIAIYPNVLDLIFFLVFSAVVIYLVGVHFLFL